MIKHQLLPVLNIGFASLPYFSFGLFFGVNEFSDRIFNIMTIQAAFGAVAQIAWFAAIPPLYSESDPVAKKTIVSTVVVNMILINSVYVLIAFLLEDGYKNYFNAAGALYSMFFQMHLFFKHSYIGFGWINKFYIFDIIGYLLSFGWIVLCAILRVENIGYLFIGMAFSWMIVLLLDARASSDNIGFVYDWKYSRALLKKSLKSRAGGVLGSAKDFALPYLFETLARNGEFTVYSYVTKICLSVYQAIPINYVNSLMAKRELNFVGIAASHVNKIALRSLSFYLAVISFIFANAIVFFFCAPDLLQKVNASITLVLGSAMVAFYCILSYEQIYSRIVYLCSNFSFQVRADLANFVIFICFVGLSVLFNNLYFAFVGLVLGQIFSVLTYRSFFK